MDILSFACPTLAPQIRVIKDERGEPWFVAADLCGMLNLGNVTAAVRRLPEGDSRVISGNPDDGLPASVNVVSEPGMYWLVIRSDKREARPLIMWITHEVLPSIRRTGQYIMPGQRKPTRWGWQPIRDVVRAQGYSAKDFTASANALELSGVPEFTEGNYAAWTYGGCLPAEALLVRAEALLGVPREQLFTSNVLTHYQDRGAGKRHTRPAVPGTSESLAATQHGS